MATEISEDMLKILNAGEWNGFDKRRLFTQKMESGFGGQHATLEFQVG
jgi:hypothetical protein